MNSRLLINSIVLFCGLIIAGIVSCLPLYHGDIGELRRSPLWTKIIWWAPLFGGLLVLLYSGRWLAILMTVLVSLLAAQEVVRQSKARRRLGTLYALAICLLFSSLVLYWHWPAAVRAPWLLGVAFASALSDIVAFFSGRYLGRHHLPDYLNHKKSWEGVGGQLVGGLLGWQLIRFAAGGLPWWAGLLIGVASASGDLANSFIKRRLGIADWGQTIPGHGGVLDRFSSLSAALAVGYYLLLLTS